MPQVWPTDIYPYRLPSWYLQHNTTAFISPITRSRQVLRRQGERWRCDASFRLNRPEAQRLDALLAKLKGAYDTVTLWDFARERPLGVNLASSTLSGITFFTDTTGFTDGTGFAGGHAVRVYGSHVLGSLTLNTEGWLQSIAGQLLAGDYLEAGGFLYMVTDDAASDAGGNAVLSIAPPLQSVLADGDAINFIRARASMQLVDDDQPARSIGVNTVFEYSLSFVQAL